MADWTILSLLQTTAGFFQKQAIPTSRLDAELLLAETLGMKRVELYMYADKPLTQEEIDAYRLLVKRRAQREPVAYILGRREFYSVELEVGPGVLIPRPETELVVDRALAALNGGDRSAPPLLLDVCTGSAAIPIAALLNHASCRAIGADASSEALSWARRNLERHDLSQRLGLVQGDLLAPVPSRFRGQVDVLTCNPPYLTAAELASLDPGVAFEPRAALDGGRDGLDLYRRLATDALPWLRPEGSLILEIGCQQGPAVADLLRGAGWQGVEIVQDLARLDRVVTARRPAAA